MGANCSELVFPDANVTEHLLNVFGPRCFPPAFKWSTLSIYALILVVGVFGNVGTCAMICRHPSMRTPTNFYLFSLAISDLITLLLGLPYELYTLFTVQYPQTLPLGVCKVRGFVSEGTTYASVLTIAAFSVERWLAICFPLRVKMFSQLSRSVKVICLIWLTAGLSASPLLYFVTYNRVRLPPNYSDPYNISADGVTIPHTDFCAMDHDDLHAQSCIINTSFWLFFFAPMAAMLGFYAHIATNIRRAKRQQRTMMNSLMRRRARHAQSRTSVIPMLAAVVLAFFICWLPFHVQRLMIVTVTEWTELQQKIFNIVFYISGCFYYLNSAVNPLLYNVLNRKFRRAFLHMLCHKCLSDRLPDQSAEGGSIASQPAVQAVTLRSRSQSDPICASPANERPRRNAVAMGRGALVAASSPKSHTADVDLSQSGTLLRVNERPRGEQSAPGSPCKDIFLEVPMSARDQVHRV